MKPVATIIELPMGAIRFVHGWNCRRSVGADSLGGPESQHRFEDLVESLRQGQDEAVIVRKIKGSDGLYQLIAGFRRFAAISSIYEEDAGSVAGVTRGYIKAEVRELDDVQALALNARENVARENLSVPDLMFAVSRFDKKYTAQWIATHVGLSEGYVGRLRRAHAVMKTIPFEQNGKVTDAFTHWRDNPSIVNTRQAFDLVERTKPEEREEMFRSMLAINKTIGKGFALLPKRASQFAQQIAALHESGVIKVQRWDWIEMLTTSGVVPKGLPASEYRKLDKICQMAAEEQAEIEI